MYVWFDALVNYISTLGWPSYAKASEDKISLFEKFWSGTKNCVQVAGKDQVRQQACMWQAMLMSADLPLTGQIFIHGFILSGGQKMSKSIGNVIEPFSIVDTYGTDALRYFLLRHIHPTEDSDFTMPVFESAYNAGLVNGIGNLTSRIMKLAETHLTAPIVRPKPTGFAAEYTTALEHFEFNTAMEYVWGRIQALDQHIQNTEPFKVVKVDAEKGRELIAGLCAELYHIARLLQPLLPQTSDIIKEAVLVNKKPENMFPRK
jgi:methionyl-tRNA synthetase